MDTRREPAYLTTEEAAAMLGVQPRTVRTYIRDGRLPSLVTRVGFRRQHLILKTDVEALAREAGQAQ